MFNKTDLQCEMLSLDKSNFTENKFNNLLNHIYVYIYNSN